MKTKFLIEIESDFTVAPFSVETALKTLNGVSNVAVEFQGTVVSIPQRLPDTFETIRMKAEKAGEFAVDSYLKNNPEPMYCGIAFLYSLKPKPRTRTGKMVEDVQIRPTGFAANTQSLDLQEMWCDAAEAVFKEHGIKVGYKSWVD